MLWYTFTMKHLCLFVVSAVFSASATPLTLPWADSKATHRTVCQITAAHPQQDTVVTLPLTVLPRDATTPVALFDADAPLVPLPFFASTNGLTLVLPGKLAPKTPRHMVAYQGGSAASPRLPAPPSPSADFARTVLGRAWDFEDGTPCGITSWGNGPQHIGPITVTNGWLQVPVKDTDPYFIFGDMFGPPDSPRGLRIDSAAYRYLELRVRQSCPSAQWSFFITDRDGRYKSLDFTVKGTAAQTFLFDLKSSFPEFWDGRLFRALRVDTTNNRKGLLAEVDHVRFLPEAPAVRAGPLFPREAVSARADVARLDVTLPRTFTAGERQSAKAKVGGTRDTAALRWSFVTGEHGAAFLESTGPGETDAIPLPCFKRAGMCDWSFGLADDLGQPLHTVTGTLRVEPAALAAFRLTPARAFIDLAAPTAVISVEGLDAFGNALPVNVKSPRWTLPAGTQAPKGRLRGQPATVALTLPKDAPATHRLALADAGGHTGTATITTVTYRKNTVRLNPNGYLVSPDGQLVFPSGGLYANWPHRALPDGSVTRAVDLFPCGPTPYKEGFPWQAGTEAAVGAYLKHCSERGITCLRLMLRNMDLVGRVDPVQLQATLHLFDLARPYGIRFNVALFEDYSKPPYVSREMLETIVLPHYTPEQLASLPPHRARFLVRRETLETFDRRYTDPDAIACQQDYLRELIPVLAAREEVLCYEFENEMVFPPMSWCRTIAATLRAIDPHTLVLGNPGPHDWPVPLTWRESGCDLYSFHPYNDGQPLADHGAIIFLRSKFSAQTGLPMYTGEGGINQNRWEKGITKMTPAASARGARDQIWMSVCCGANGCLYWTLDHDAEAQEFEKIKPALDALDIDLASMKRQRPAVALVLPQKRRDSRDAAMAMRLLSLGTDFDTVTAQEAGAYAVTIDLDKQAPESVTLPATVAAPAPGWQIATLVSEKRNQALLYLRNVGGGVKDFGAKPRPCYLRDVQNAEAAFTLSQPKAWRSVTVFDLDTRQAYPAQPDAAGRITLQATSHDFLIGLRN